MFELRPLSERFAAEILGLDVSVPLPDEIVAAIRDAFVEYSVLAFRDQRLDKQQQLAFTRQFGAVDVHAAVNEGDDVPVVHTVSNLD